jgi:putative membrane protein
MIDYLRALHLIFIITWFSGLFYIIRLFIYQTEANDKTETERDILVPQFQLISKRLWYGITWPSMILVTVFGTWLVVEQPVLLNQPWFHWKLGMLIGLFSYHFYSHKIFQELQNNEYNWTSFKLRLWNEVATVFLFAIIFTVMVFRYTMDVTTGIIGIVVILSLLVGGVYGYKKMRGKK